MFTEYVFENRKYDIALRDVKSILFDIVMSEQEKVTSIISKVRTTGNEELQEKLITLCNEQGECLRNLLEISNSFSENLQLLDSYSRELKKIENKNIASIISEMRSENANARKKKKAKVEENTENNIQQAEPVIETEQVAQPEPVVQTEQIVQSEPVAQTEQVAQPEPVAAPEEPTEQPVLEQPPVEGQMEATEQKPATEGDLKLNIPPELLGKKLTFKSTAKPVQPEGETQPTEAQTSQTQTPEQSTPAEPQPEPVTAPATPAAEKAENSAEDGEKKEINLGDLKLEIPPDLMGKKITFKSTAKPVEPEGETQATEAQTSEQPTPAEPQPVMEEAKKEPANEIKTETPTETTPVQDNPTNPVTPVIEPEGSTPVKAEQPTPAEKTTESQPAEAKPVENVNEVESKPLLPLIPEEPVVESTQPQEKTISETTTPQTTTPQAATTQTQPENQKITTIKKENTDDAKAIITSAKQTESLRNSLGNQETLLNSSGFFQNNTNTAAQSDENLEKNLIQNGLLPQESIDLQKQVEQKMAEANKLYAEGKMEEAQKIFDEINTLGNTIQPQEAVTK
ncbi:MAG: hypothetical protein IJG68_01280 [Bacilli bacterium]|nr:hypothetical protein [Bacilli bacterium]